MQRKATYFLPIRRTKSPKASFPEGSLPSGATVFSTYEVQVLCSLPSDAIVGEEGIMQVHLTQQAQELLGKSELVVIPERVDDVALRIGQMVKMGFVEVLDKHLPQHWKQRGVSWGWTAVIWLAYILTEGDHRKVSVEAYITGMHNTLSHLSGQSIEPLDCSDDRLGHLLTH